MVRAGFRNVCADILNGTEGALGCALVDLETGLPLTLEVKPGGLLNATSMELLSAMGVSHFDQGGVRDLDDGTSDAADAVQEVQTTTEDAYYFMARVPGNPQELLVLATDPGATNLGLGWLSLRQALARVRAANSDTAADAPPGSSRRAVPGDPSQDRVFAMRARNRRSIWD